MPRSNTQNPHGANSLANLFCQRLQQALSAFQQMPQGGARDLPVVRGLSPDCTTTENLENCLEQITTILVESGRVYVQGSDVVLETRQQGTGSLVPLATAGKVEENTPGRLANLFVCEHPTKSGGLHFPPTSRIAKTALAREPTLQRLPRINLYAKRPLYDQQFNLRGDGWHADVGILVHGVSLDPHPPEAKPDCERPIKERLPPHLRQLLSGFCLRSDADVANTVSVLLTGLLMPHFIDCGHPLALLDGNQPGVGKTLLARTLSLVLDDVDPRVIDYSPNDEELGKRVVAQLRESRQSCLVFDNAKLRSGQVVSSPFIEANSAAPELSLRILGVSQNYSRPNDLLWFLTMNETKTSPDIASRQIAIQFRHEGDPSARQFGDDPLEYARQHRVALLSELAGMVEFWKLQGQPPGTKSHRFGNWARIIGGILEANGLPEFLDNQEFATAEFNAELDELTALVEQVLKVQTGPKFTSDSEAQKGVKEVGKKASDWAPLFEGAGLLEDKLKTAASAQAKGKLIGAFLLKYVGRTVTLQQGDGEVRATLRKHDSRGKTVLYAFEVTATSPPTSPTETESMDDTLKISAKVPQTAKKVPNPGKMAVWTPQSDPKPEIKGVLEGNRVRRTGWGGMQKATSPRTSPKPAPLAVGTGNSEAWG